MRDLRFTGRIEDASGSHIVDIRLRTDMINDDDALFNITQIQEGQQFDTNSEKDSPVFQKYFANTFKRINCALADVIQFAIDNGLGLRMYDANGVPTNLIADSSDSFNG